MFRALSTWVLLRGHRYQVREEGFFRFALAPHDDALKRAYGVGAVGIGPASRQSPTKCGLGSPKVLRRLSSRWQMRMILSRISDGARSRHDGYTSYGFRAICKADSD